MWVSGKETGFRCLSRSLAATTPPPSVSSSFFLFSARGHSTRHFWKVSLKARDGGARPISGSARATRGKTNPQEGGQTAQVMARRQEPGASPSESGTHTDGQLGWGRGAALAGLVSPAVEQGVGVGRGEKGKFPSRTRKLGPASVDGGWRAGACGHRAGIAGSKRSISRVLHPARRFPAGGFSARSRAGSQVCVEPRRPPLFSQPGQALPRGLPLPVLQGAAPPASPRRSLGEKRFSDCGDQRRSRWDRGIALCLDWMEIK